MQDLPRLAAHASCVACLAVLAACGGGGADESVPAAAPATPTTATADTAVVDCSIPAFSSAALARINQVRAAGASCGAYGNFAPAGAVRWSQALTEAAAAHSLDMAAQNYFSHTSADGRTLSQRIDATGFQWSALGENIAAGQVGVDAVVQAWMLSDGHCANMLNPDFDTIGMACVPGSAGNTYRTYWTLDLARAR